MCRSRRTALAALALLGIVGVGCSGDDESSTASEENAVVTVFAAASLTDAFTELGEAFGAAEPDTEVTFNFGASSDLVTQIAEGAPADVFASADPDTMSRLVDGDDNGSEPVVFTTNRAEIIVEAGNPEGIAGVADLAREELIVVSCAPEVPCGRYTEQILDNAGVTVAFKSFEENVRAVVSKVAIGEADAGIVYVTDVLAAGDAVDGVAIPADLNVIAEYPIAVTRTARDRRAAEAFVEFVMSDDGQAILESYGFAAP
jgi:molybdate transport system substrate-binding protein